jgi:hypothetical protein
VVEPAQAFVAHRPNSILTGEGKVSELNILFVPFAGWGLGDGSTSLAGDPAQPIIVRKPDGAIWGLMENSVVGGRGQNEGGGGRTGIVIHPFKPGLTGKQKEQSTGKRSYPNRSFTVHQNGCGEATRVSMFRANLFTDRAVHVEEAARRLQPEGTIPVLGDSFHLQDGSTAPIGKRRQPSIFPEEKSRSPCL